MFPLGNHLNFSGYEARNMVLQNLTGFPSTPKPGQEFYHSGLGGSFVWNGVATQWRPTDAALLADGSIKIAALEVDPRARGSHTGTQVAATISDLDATIKGYRLDQLTAPTVAVSWNSQRLTTLADAINDTDAVNLRQLVAAVQQAAAAIDSKPSVRVLAAGNITLSGLQTIDGVGLNANDRVLAPNQTDATKSGVWVAQSGPWIRATDADQTGEITPGAFWFVEEGTAYGKTQWRCNNTGTITLGTTAVQIVQFGGVPSYTAGNGLQLVGSEFSAKTQTGGGIVATVAGLAMDRTVAPFKATGVLAGDGSTTSFTFTHNLNTDDIVVSVRDVATKTMILTTMVTATVNTLTLSFGQAPPSGTNYRVVAIG